MSREWTREQSILFEDDGQGRLLLPRVAVSADAGAGKTSVLVERIRRLSAGLPPQKRVLCVSFTEKSKADLEERLMALPFCEVYTIHGFCLRVISEFGAKLGLPPVFRVLSQDESFEFFEQAFEKAYRRHPPGSATHGARAFFDLCLKAGSLGERAEIKDMAGDGASTAEFVDEVIQEFNAAKRAARALEYNDLERHAASLLESPDVAQALSLRYAHVFVDEFQDTSEIQCALVKRLAGEKGALFVVGDSKQSIYRFRGADVGVFERFTKTLPAQKRLSVNFRSHPEVIAAVNDACRLLLANYGEMSAGREEKKSMAAWDAVPRVARITAETDAPAILAIVRRLRSEGVALTDMVLLLQRIRGNEGLFEELAKGGLAIAAGSSAGAERSEIVQKLVNLWVWAAEPWQRLRAARVIVDFEEESARGSLGKRLEEFQKIPIHGLSCEQLIGALEQRFHLQERWGVIFEQFKALVLRAQSEGLSCASLARRFDRLDRKGRALDGFALLAPPENLSGALRVMTVHGAKGLEFPVVILADVKGRRTRAPAYVSFKERLWLPQRDEEGRLDKSSDELKDALAAEATAQLEESARLLYVAMTRAQEALYVVDRPDEAEIGKKTKKQKASWSGWLKAGLSKTIPAETFAQDEALPFIGSYIRSAGFQKSSTPFEAQEPRYERARLGVTELVQKERPQARKSKTQDRERFQASQARLGTAVHGYLEKGDWEGLKRLAEREDLSIEPFWGWLKTEIGESIFASQGRSYPEFAFEWKTSSGIVTGRIDRLVVFEGEAWVIDYKVLQGHRAVGDILPSYAPQLAIYAEAVKELTKSTNVRAFIIDVLGATGQICHEVDCAKSFTALP